MNKNDQFKILIELGVGELNPVQLRLLNLREILRAYRLFLEVGHAKLNIDGSSIFYIRIRSVPDLGD